MRILSTLVAYPLIALVLSGAFVGLWHWRWARSAVIAGLLWLIYGSYEYLVYARILCSGECNIRVDLLVIYPLLLVISIVAVWNSARGRAARAQRPDSPARRLLVAEAVVRAARVVA